MPHQIALFGKGGVGKTTIAANLAAALAEAGHRALLVGLSPTADTSYLLMDGAHPPAFQDGTQADTATELGITITDGYRGVGCIELSESCQAGGCSSRAIAESIQKLERSAAIDAFAPDYILFDIAGDISCSGPVFLRGITIQTALLVASADFQSMFAINRHVEVICNLLPWVNVALIANANDSSFEDSLVADYANKVGITLAATIPRSLTVRHSELYGKTVIEAAPLSTHAYAYRRLARLIIENGVFPGAGSPRPLTGADIQSWARGWGERLGELAFGIIQDGAGI